MQKITIDCRTENLDEYRRLAELAVSIGATHLAASQVEPAIWQWDLDRTDPYPNWSMYRPSIFKFIVPDELKPYLPTDYAERNLETLVKRAEILKEFGLKAIFWGMEPAWFPEQAYLDHPGWRGPRCDQMRRSRKAYYAPCTDNAEVRAMYIDAIEKLCQVAPFEHFQLLTNDSGGGICWSTNLYPGANGPLCCRDKSIGRRIADFLSLFQEGAARAGVTAGVDVWNISDPNMAAALPELKPGQSINMRTLKTRGGIFKPGFSDTRRDPTFPVYLLPRMTVYARQLNEAQFLDQNTDIGIQLRSIDDTDTIALLKQSFGKMSAGLLGQAQALDAAAAAFVGGENAAELTEIWSLIDSGASYFDPFQIGGHMFYLGTVHQRWLTRPLVAFPEELSAEEKSYYRPFLFQAQGEEEANNMLDMQASYWLNGNSGLKLIRMVTRTAMPLLQKAVKLTVELLEKLGPAHPYYEHLALVRDRIKLYICIVRNALDTISFQTIIDRTDRTVPPTDSSPDNVEQGDVRFYRVREILRDEIDNSNEIISLIENARGRLLMTAPDEKNETILVLGPDIVNDLKKKIKITLRHERDFFRLYKSYNY